MGRPSNLERMSYGDLIALQDRITRLKAQRQAQQRDALRQTIADMAKAEGFELKELFGKNGGRHHVVLPKYRDPENPDRTWAGRGRMPNWMTQSGKPKETFLIR